MLVSASTRVDACGRRFTAPLRASVVSALARSGRCLPAESSCLEPPLTPLSLFDAPGCPGGSSSRDRFTSHRVNDTQLPRPGVPSPFASRELMMSRVNRLVNHTLARMAPQDERCRSLGHRGGDATQHLIRSHHGNSLVLARDHGSSRERRTTSDRRSDRDCPNSLSYPTKRPVKNAPFGDPFIVAWRCILATIGGRVFRAASNATPPPLARHVSSRRLGASESRIACAHVALRGRERLAPACGLPGTFCRRTALVMNVGTRHTRGGGP